MIEDVVARVRANVPFTALNTVIREVDSRSQLLLDAGCGRGDAMAALKPHLGASTVGLDIFLPYLKECREKQLHDIYVRGDVRLLPFRDNAFDTVISIEVLEHLEKKDARLFLSEMERVAALQVILTTPNGHFHLDAFDGNPHQEHRSEWSPTEMRALGYRVVGRGLRGLGPVIQSSAGWAKATRPLQYLAWAAAGPLASLAPRLAGDLVCIKERG